MSQSSLADKTPSPQVGSHSPATHKYSAGQATEADQSAQPEACCSHVCVSLPKHCFAPWVHTSVHEHTPLEQVVPAGQLTGGDQS